jgi:hypothetical protein
MYTLVGINFSFKPTREHMIYKHICPKNLKGVSDMNIPKSAVNNYMWALRQNNVSMRKRENEKKKKKTRNRFMNL